MVCEKASKQTSQKQASRGWVRARLLAGAHTDRLAGGQAGRLAGGQAAGSFSAKCEITGFDFCVAWEQQRACSAKGCERPQKWSTGWSSY